MTIKYKRLYEILNDEALVDELIEICRNDNFVLSFDFDDHYNKIGLMKDEILRRMTK